MEGAEINLFFTHASRQREQWLETKLVLTFLPPNPRMKIKEAQNDILSI